MIDQATEDLLVDRAKENFMKGKVSLMYPTTGAALLGKSGKIYDGASLTFKPYTNSPATHVYAETAALAQGLICENEFDAIAFYQTFPPESFKPDSQTIGELALLDKNKTCEVIIQSTDGERKRVQLSDYTNN